MVSPAEVDQFAGLIGQLAGHAVTDAKQLVAATAGDTAALADAYPAVVLPYTDAAGLLTAQWCHELAPDSAHPMQMAAPPAADELAASARWASAQTDTTAALAGSTERRVFNAQRETVAANAAADKSARYYRHARPDACAWCRVLATRGPVYHSAKAATASHGITVSGTKSHDSCYCTAVLWRPGDPWERPDYMDGWEADYEVAYRDAKADDPRAGLDDIVNHMRRTDRARARQADVFGGLSQSEPAPESVFGNLSM